MTHTLEKPLVRAARLIFYRGRSYKVRKYGLALKVFTPRVTEADLLCLQFAGGYYRMFPARPNMHWYQWSVTRIEHLDYILKTLRGIYAEKDFSDDIQCLAWYLAERGYASKPTAVAPRAIDQRT